ncbi:MAG: hypothetical protein COU66_02135 [Candidatus Pacebacteria bacterium CG10_big_fil_rev_8_21_14_0_10_44_11]|nr:MAG: hypothetical protein COU66_02135 [Candidatus Pacebacteria bacterium CG10_big_fil_rev_8_21_14_0_10_44_11]
MNSPPKTLPSVSQQQRQINRYLAKAYAVYSGQKTYQVIARIAVDIAHKAGYAGSRNIIVRKAVFDHFVKHFTDKSGNIDTQRLFQFVRTLLFPDEIYQSSKGRLNFFKNLENFIENQVVVDKARDVPNTSLVVTQFDNLLINAKDKKYIQRQKNTMKQVFSSNSGRTGYCSFI